MINVALVLAAQTQLAPGASLFGSPGTQLQAERAPTTIDPDQLLRAVKSIRRPAPPFSLYFDPEDAPR